ncbi:MAG: PAS domain S-box protein [Thermodesulfobacteriota bacterium]
MRRTIAGDLIIGLVVVVGLTSLFVASFNYFVAAKKAEATFRQKADEYLRYLQESITIPLWTLDLENVRKICDALYKSESIHGIRVLNYSNEVLFDKNKGHDPHTIRRDGRIFREGMHLGTIRMTLTMKPVHQSNMATLRSNLLTMLAALVMMIGAARYLMGSFLKRPLADLIRRIDRIAEGEYGEADYSPKQREIAAITETVNRMAGKIKDREERLSLEMKDRVKAHEALLESEEKYRALFETSLDAIAITRESGEFIDVNQSFVKLFGYDKEELIRVGVENLWIHRSARSAWLKVMTREGAVMDYAIRGRRKDGRELDCILTSTARRVKTGEIHFQTICRDITLRKQTEDELRRLRTFLSNIIDSMPSVLIGVNRNRQVTHWNAEAEKKTGVPEEVAIGRLLVDVYPQMQSEMENVGRAIQECAIQAKAKIRSFAEDGEERFSDITVYPLVADGVEGAVIRIDDVTDRVRIEERMIQSEKMASVGGLAAGMAHEINNPLAGILQSAAVIERYMSPGNAGSQKAANESGATFDAVMKFMERRGVSRMLNNIRDSAERAARIVENMLSFSRKSGPYRGEHDLADLLDKTIALAENDYDLKKHFDFRNIRIIREYASGLPRIRCEGSKLQQVFLNILKNGAQAMAENRAGEACFVLRILPDDDMIRIEIEDNGPGMAEQVRRRVFEPFFTTKGVQRGTGLGLSISYFIITEQHGGSIAVESSPGQGARFIIRLPVA